jgi:hypothetical protein
MLETKDTQEPQVLEHRFAESEVRYHILVETQMVAIGRGFISRPNSLCWFNHSNRIARRTECKAVPRDGEQGICS